MMTKLEIHGTGIVVNAHHDRFVEFLEDRFRRFHASEIDPSMFVDVSFAEPPFDPERGRSLPDGVYKKGNCLYYTDGSLTVCVRFDEIMRIDAYLDPSLSRHLGRLLTKGRQRTWHEYFEYFLIRRGIQLPLFWLLQREGFYPVHASAVAGDDGAYVFAGGAGAGKTTLALEIATDGYTLLGDNIVFLKDGDVYPYPEMLRVTDYTLDRVDGLEPTGRSVFGQSVVELADGEIGADPVPLEELFLIDRGSFEHAPVQNPIDRLVALMDAVGEFHTHHWPRMLSYLTDEELPGRRDIYADSLSDVSVSMLQYTDIEEVREVIGDG